MRSLSAERHRRTSGRSGDDGQARRRDARSSNTWFGGASRAAAIAGAGSPASSSTASTGERPSGSRATGEPSSCRSSSAPASTLERFRSGSSVACGAAGLRGGRSSLVAKSAEYPIAVRRALAERDDTSLPRRATRERPACLARFRSARARGSARGASETRPLLSKRRRLVHAERPRRATSAGRRRSAAQATASSSVKLPLRVRASAERCAGRPERFAEVARERSHVVALARR
jgi:hypothetical protein